MADLDERGILAQDGILTAQGSMKKLTIRLSDELHDQLAARARADQRSLNKQVVWIIEQMTGGEKSQDTAHAQKGKTKGSAE